MAQRINRGVQKVAKRREQEDAQEFLTFLLDSTHQELLKLRAMYGTEGESAAAPMKRKENKRKEKKRKEKKRKEKKRKEKKRKEKKRKRREKKEKKEKNRHFDLKPSIIPGCPALLHPTGFKHTFNDKTNLLLHGYYSA